MIRRTLMRRAYADEPCRVSSRRCGCQDAASGAATPPGGRGGPVGWYAERVVPRLTDRSLDVEELAPVREQVCAGLEGRVLEIGFGSGLNVAHYPAGVVEVSAVEPS